MNEQIDIIPLKVFLIEFKDVLKSVIKILALLFALVICFGMRGGMGSNVYS